MDFCPSCWNLQKGTQKILLDFLWYRDDKNFCKCAHSCDIYFWMNCLKITYDYVQALSLEKSIFNGSDILRLKCAADRFDCQTATFDLNWLDVQARDAWKKSRFDLDRHREFEVCCARSNQPGGASQSNLDLLRRFMTRMANAWML